MESMHLLAIADDGHQCKAAIPTSETRQQFEAIQKEMLEMSKNQRHTLMVQIEQKIVRLKDCWDKKVSEDAMCVSMVPLCDYIKNISKYLGIDGDDERDCWTTWI